MSVPQSLGAWVAFERDISLGPRAADLARELEICHAIGASWVALRAGAGSKADEDLSEQSIVTLDDAGIAVYLWPFCYANVVEGEMALLARWAKLKRSDGTRRVQGVILNAEFQFAQNATPAEGAALVARTRALGYDFVAHAPPDYLGGAGKGPLAVLDAVCDAIMPQCYAWEHNDQGHVHTIDEVLALYAARGYSMAKVWPILCTYRPRVRGTTKDGHPIPTPPLANEGALVAADVVAGMDRLDARGGCPAPSLYTIEALRTASRPGVGEAVLAALSVRARCRMMSVTVGTAGAATREAGLQLADDTAKMAASTIAEEVHRMQTDPEQDGVDTPWATPRARVSSQKIPQVRPEDDAPDTEKP